MGCQNNTEWLHKGPESVINKDVIDDENEKPFKKLKAEADEGLPSANQRARDVIVLYLLSN